MMVVSLPPALGVPGSFLRAAMMTCAVFAIGLAFGWLVFGENGDRVMKALEGGVQTLMVGVTFALIVIGIKSFEIQEQIRLSRLQIEKLQDELREKVERADRVVRHMPGTYANLNEIIMELADENTGLPEIFRKHVQRSAMSLYWERRYLDMVLSDDFRGRYAACLDLVGSIEGRPNEAQGLRPVLDTMGDTIVAMIKEAASHGGSHEHPDAKWKLDQATALYRQYCRVRAKLLDGASDPAPLRAKYNL